MLSIILLELMSRGPLVVPTFSKRSEPGVVDTSVLCAGDLRMSAGGRVIMGLESSRLDPNGLGSYCRRFSFRRRISFCC